MKTKTTVQSLGAIVLLALGLLGLPCFGKLAQATDCDQTKEGQLRDAQIEPYQDQLLTLGFSAASAFPLMPHAKNRSRNQASIVQACLELGLPLRASDYVGRIENWRRGMGYADLAHYAAVRGANERALSWIQLAEGVANAGEQLIQQAWRRDRILARVAETQLLLGDETAARKIEAGLIEDEAGRLLSARTLELSDSAFGAQLAAIDASLMAGSLEQVRAALATGAQLYGRYFEEEERRTKLESKLRSAWTKAPRQMAIDLIMELGASAVAHANKPLGLSLVEEAQLLLDAVNWIPEERIKLDARLAKLRFEAGDTKRARRDLDAARLTYAKQREKIVDIWRGRTLRQLAESYHAMGDSQSVLVLYRSALDESMINPNSRPRADDLVATCVSMVLNEIEPDPLLMSRLREICAGLGDPW